MHSELREAWPPIGCSPRRDKHTPDVQNLPSADTEEGRGPKVSGEFHETDRGIEESGYRDTTEAPGNW